MTGVLERFRMESSSGIPFLAPENVLLYKLPRFGDHDRRDFEACAPILDEKRRTWLVAAIETVDPEHPWLEEL